MKAVKILTIVAVAIALQLMVASASMAAPANGCGTSGGGYHVVCKGETLFSIGRMYGVYPYAIAEANGLWNPDVIYAGQALYIPAGASWNPCHSNNPCQNQGWNNNPCYGENPCWNNNNWNNNSWNNNNWDNTSVHNPCYDNCGSTSKPYQYGYGHDNAGYYYDNYYPGQTYERYSYPCGYNYNCY